MYHTSIYITYASIYRCTLAIVYSVYIVMYYISISSLVIVHSVYHKCYDIRIYINFNYVKNEFIF